MNRQSLLAVNLFAALAIASATHAYALPGC
jgi:hypothetical protein